MGRNFRLNLTVKSVFFAAVFMFILIFAQYLLFYRIMKGPTGAGLSADEQRLYRESLYNAARYFDEEVGRLKVMSTLLGGKIEVAYKTSRIREVQAYFNRLSADVPGIENIFLFNSMGRLLAFTPYNDDYHWNIYDFARYYSVLKSEMIRQKVPAFTYYYLNDPAAINSGMKSGLVIQPPYFIAKDLEKLSLGGQLAHDVLSYVPDQPRLEQPVRKRKDAGRKVPQQDLTKTPFFVVASPFFLEKRYWGMTGFMVSMDWLARKAYSHLPADMMVSFIVNTDGYLAWYPESKDIGKKAGKDSLVAALVKVARKDGMAGTLYYKNIFVFYRNTSGLIFAAIPSRMIGRPTDPSDVLKPILSRMIAIFIFEFILAILLFMIFYNKIMLALKELVKKHGEGVKGLEGESEIEDIAVILDARKSSGMGILTTRIVSPALIDEFKKSLDDLTSEGKPIEGAAVYINIRNAMDVLKESSESLNQFVTRLYQLSEEKHGYVTQCSFHTFLVYFGVPFKDQDFARRTAEFLTGLLVMTAEFNKDRKLTIRAAFAAEAGMFICGKFHFNDQEEIFINSAIIDDLSKYESVARESVAILGENLYKAKLVPEKIIRQEVTLKVRGASEPRKVYALKN